MSRISKIAIILLSYFLHSSCCLSDKNIDNDDVVGYYYPLKDYNNEYLYLKEGGTFIHVFCSDIKFVKDTGRWIILYDCIIELNGIRWFNTRNANDTIRCSAFYDWRCGTLNLGLDCHNFYKKWKRIKTKCEKEEENSM